MSQQKFDGTYNVTIFIPERGSYQSMTETMTISTATEGSDEVLQPTSQLSFMSYTFQLSGRINTQTGLATISGQATDSGVSLDPALWSFVSTPALQSVSAARVVFNGAAAIGFCFSLFGMKEGQETFEGQSIPELFMKDFQATTRPVPKM
ncbi:hypothetical protein [Desulfoluna spongiiphila]|uniref:Uncharacterized protein n=1 Tax=Desulfoluna spongiiphila TaxID=419481 RepID=A0A1G5J4X8_9BACT|nr:hypothetical protein [Desulfoluna spongiiphila]SCY83342.1 hypothetical protein SAMN05216233_12517 [Desulfoluna spongiiphila]